jgi:hypothetical protein
VQGLQAYLIRLHHAKAPCPSGILVHEWQLRDSSGTARLQFHGSSIAEQHESILTIHSDIDS